MLHKFFKWRYERNRPGAGPLRDKVEKRTKARDLAESILAFGDDSANSRRSRWLLKRILAALSALLLLALSLWLAYQSYLGLLIYD